MKTYDFGGNLVVQAAMRHYANYGVIPQFDDFMDEMHLLLSKLAYYEEMEIKYADLLEENHELREINKGLQKNDNLHTPMAPKR